MPWAGPIFMVITELGSELFYVALILTGYWAFKKRESVLTVFVLIVSVATNYWLKALIANERPSTVYWYEGVTASNYSTPSGHSQNSAALFGWFAARVRTRWMAVISIVLTILIGISRIYLGVHYLGDVLLGWSIGLCLAAAAYYLADPIENCLSPISDGRKYSALFLFGLFITLITELLATVPDDNFGSIGGLIMGVAIALPLERRFVDFDVHPKDGKTWRLAIRVIVGLILVIAVMIGLSSVLVTEVVWLRAIRYALTASVGVFVWPMVFKRLDL